jgi:hypothetical protein
MSDKVISIGNKNTRPILDESYVSLAFQPKIAADGREVEVVRYNSPNADLKPVHCEVIPKELTVYTGKNEECLDEPLRPKNAIYIHCYNKDGYWIDPHIDEIRTTLRYQFTYPQNRPFHVYRDDITGGTSTRDPWNVRRIDGYLPGTYSLRVEVDNHDNDLKPEQRAARQGKNAITDTVTIHVKAEKPPATNSIELNYSKSIKPSPPLGNGNRRLDLQKNVAGALTARSFSFIKWGTDGNCKTGNDNLLRDYILSQKASWSYKRETGPVPYFYVDRDSQNTLVFRGKDVSYGVLTIKIGNAIAEVDLEIKD